MKGYRRLTLPQRYEISALHKAGQDSRCKGTSVRTQKDPFGFNALSGPDPVGTQSRATGGCIGPPLRLKAPLHVLQDRYLGAGITLNNAFVFPILAPRRLHIRGPQQIVSSFNRPDRVLKRKTYLNLVSTVTGGN